MQEHFVHSETIHRSERGIYIGDLVYGANDGIVTTFAVVSGATGAALTPGVIIILGLANLIADGVSMGMSNYLALRSKEDFQKSQRTIEESEIDDYPDQERNEVRDILKRWHVAPERIEPLLDDLTRDRKTWVDIMMREELGIIEDSVSSPAQHGVMTTIAFVIAGALPLLPYVLGVPPHMRFLISVVATATALFAVGAARTHVTGAPWVRSGFQMLGVGAIAAAGAYAVGHLVQNVFGITL